jgi:hypothetical protein
MVPHAAPLHPEPLTVQFTAAFELPVTVGANCCVLPNATVALLGLTCTATPAATATLRVAALLVTLPALLLTTTTNNVRLSASVVGGVVYLEEVAPITAVPFFSHW